MASRATCAPAWGFPTPRNDQTLNRIATLTQTTLLTSLRKEFEGMTSSSKFDIVVYGATGFTGQLVAEYLAAHYGDTSAPRLGLGRPQPGKARRGPRCDRRARPISPLIDGRRRRRGFAERDGRPGQLVLIHGRPLSALRPELVAACAATGTDYVDLCGEPAWMRQMIDAHEADGAKKPARASCSPAAMTRFRSNSARFLCRKTPGACSARRSARVKGRVRQCRGPSRAAPRRAARRSSRRPRRIRVWSRFCAIRSL